MKKFKYKIEAYLKFLLFEREKKLKEVKDAESFWVSLRNKFTWMESEMKKAWKTNSEMGRGISDINYIQDNNQFIKMLKSHMQDLSLEIAHAEADYEKKYKSFLELQLKIKKVELHKEGKREEHKKMKKKLEQKQLDEINSSRQGVKDAESL